MPLQYLIFDSSDDVEGNGSWDAMASVRAARAGLGCSTQPWAWGEAMLADAIKYVASYVYFTRAIGPFHHQAICTGMVERSSCMRLSGFTNTNFGANPFT